MYPIGLSTCNALPTEDLFAAFAAAGIPKMEISTNMRGYEQINLAAAKALSERYGIEIWSLHLPFSPFSEMDIAALDEVFRARSVAWLVDLMKRAAAVGIRRFVVHGSAEPVAREDRAQRMERSKKSLLELATTAGELGAVVCVEDLPRTCLGRDSDEMLDLLSADPRLRVCCDTNHLLTEDLPAFIRRLGAKIETLHVSDYDGVDEKHWLPGEGVLDWQAVLEALSEVGYNGPWLYEIGLSDQPRKIVRDRPLTWSDFVRNAAELFAGKRPTTFFRPAAEGESR